MDNEIWFWCVGLGLPCSPVMSKSIKLRRSGRWRAELRPGRRGNALEGITKIWLGTFDTKEEAKLVFDWAEVVMKKKNNDCVRLGQYPVREFVPGDDSSEDKCASYKTFVRDESKAYARWRMEAAADVFLNKGHGWPERPPQVIERIVLSKLLRTLRRECSEQGQVQWACDAAEYLTGTRAYDSKLFAGHEFQTHNDLGGSYGDFVLIESRRYVNFRTNDLWVVDEILSKALNLDPPDCIPLLLNP